MTRQPIQLAVLGLALFVYLTCELFPIGAFPELAAGLTTPPALVGLLLSAYAVVAGAATLPVVWWARRYHQTRLLALAMLLLALSQVLFALAPNYPVAAAARGVAALGHGFVWSQIPVVAVSLAPAGAKGRATSAVFLGSAAGLLAGAPLSAVLVHSMGWRWSSTVLAALAALCAALIVAVIPEVRISSRAAVRPTLPWRPVGVVCSVTVLLVVGHYMSYGFLEPLLAHTGWSGPLLASSLALYGIAGVIGVVLVGRLLDRRAGTAAVIMCSGLTLGTGGLFIADTPLLVISALALWGAAAGAMPPVLNTAALRVGGEAQDAASGAYVVAYQVGIATGSACGAALLSGWGVTALPLCTLTTLLLGCALITGRPALFSSSKRLAGPSSAANPTGLAR